MSAVKVILGVLFMVFALALLAIYWFVPLDNAEFSIKPGNSNFSIGNEGTEDMQFYPNMRYPDSSISYNIEGCPLGKENDMEKAFETMEGLTVLDFYRVSENEMIYVTCQERNRVENGLFIAGEGGPTQIIAGDKFNTILKGEILLIKESQCPQPNIAIHELLHVLGFDHSANPNNIMYPVTRCSHVIGEDIPDLINELYSFSSLADLGITNISAEINGRHLSTEVIIMNSGLKDSESAELRIYADESLVKHMDIDPIKLGEGKKIILTNILISKISISELTFSIVADFDELEKENNKITLEIKK